MNTNQNSGDQAKEKQEEPNTRPNEIGGFYFSSSVKITDPNTKEILVQIRGDN
jgi:hypothetical protein